MSDWVLHPLLCIAMATMTDRQKLFFCVADQRVHIVEFVCILTGVT